MPSKKKSKRTAKRKKPSKVLTAGLPKGGGKNPLIDF